MRTTKIVLLMVLTIFLFLVVVQNTASFQIHFLWFTIEMPGILLLFLTIAGGFALGLLVSLFAKSKTKSIQ